MKEITGFGLGPLMGHMQPSMFGIGTNVMGQSLGLLQPRDDKDVPAYASKPKKRYRRGPALHWNYHPVKSQMIMMPFFKSFGL